MAVRSGGGTARTPPGRPGAGDCSRLGPRPVFATGPCSSCSCSSPIHSCGAPPRMSKRLHRPTQRIELIGFRNFVKPRESDAFRQTFTGIAVVFKAARGSAWPFRHHSSSGFERFISRRGALAMGDPHRALSSLGLVVDVVQLALQRGELDRDRPGSWIPRAATGSDRSAGTRHAAVITSTSGAGSPSSRSHILAGSSRSPGSSTERRSRGAGRATSGAVTCRCSKPYSVVVHSSRRSSPSAIVQHRSHILTHGGPTISTISSPRYRRIGIE